MKTWLAVAIGWMAAVAAHAAPPERVVTLGGSVTEIVYQLGQGERLVGDDLSSLYPPGGDPGCRAVGYYRAVPVEGVLALKPDLVLASEQAGPPEALKRLGEVGVRVVTVPDSPSVDSLKARIRNVAGRWRWPWKANAWWSVSRASSRRSKRPRSPMRAPSC